MNFSDLTTLRIGGPIKEVVSVETEEELINSLQGAVAKKIPYLVIGGGSNLLVSDAGFEGLVIKNELKGAHDLGNNVMVKSGETLQSLVDFANEQGLRGLESLAGIPGTVGGAIYGNAGAYGQTISDNLSQVSVFDVKDQVRKTLVREECGFYYRDSLFKKNGNIILEATFVLTPGDSIQLKETSFETISKREVKYPPGIKCPGSFFKNIIANQLPPGILAKIPVDKVVYGKVPAGTLLEMVGARGDSLREIEIAPYHANLFINRGGGKASDFHLLANKYFDKVKESFGIELQPEVQLINLPAIK